MSKTSMTASIFLLFTGCSIFGSSSPPKSIDDARLARLPADERAGLVDQQRPVDGAKSNLETSKVALEDSKQFLGIVETEHSSALQRLDAAKKSVALNSRTAGSTGVGTDGVQSELDMATQRVDAANAKLQYAKNLVGLRTSQVELRQAELDLANADMQLARYDRLRAHDQAADMRREDFVAAQSKAQSDVTGRRNDVDARRGTVQASQRAWTELHKKWDLAAHRSDSGAATDAPPPPQPID